MDITYMHEFLVLSEHLNYTSAAAELFISQPTLTRHVNALEDQLGARLLNRRKHSVELTPCGELAVKSFTKIVAEQNELLHDIGMISQEGTSDLHLGMVYYGCSAYYGYPLLEMAAKCYPEVHISTISAQTQQIYKYLHRGVIDVGLTITSGSYGQDIERAKVATIPLYAIASPKHPLAKKEFVTLEELAKEKIILNRIPIGQRHHVEQLFLDHGIELDNIEYIDHIDQLIPVLARSGGVFIGSMLLTAVPAHNSVFIPIDAPDFTLDISLVYMKDNDNPNIEKLVKCAGMTKKPVF